jgi:hypothetical protein
MRSIILTVCVLAAVPAFAEGTAEAATTGAGEYATIDSLWNDRDNPETMQKIKADVDAALRAHPNDFEALWRAARLKQWLADGEKNKEQKMLEGKEAWALGDQATKANPKAVEGYYYAALGIGAYSQGRGILQALTEGLEGKFNQRLDTANKMDPNWQAAGGLVAKGRYWYELPWPKKSLKKAKETLESAIRTHPENLRAYVYLAETELADGDAKAAKSTLEKAQAGSVAYDGPEGRRAKNMAVPVEAQIQEKAK